MSANLRTTDETDADGARIVQRLERLDVELPGGARIVAAPHSSGAVSLRVESAPTRLVLLPPAAALRLGSHIAALGAAALGPPA